MTVGQTGFEYLDVALIAQAVLSFGSSFSGIGDVSAAGGRWRVERDRQRDREVPAELDPDDGGDHVGSAGSLSTEVCSIFRLHEIAVTGMAAAATQISRISVVRHALPTSTRPRIGSHCLAKSGRCLRKRTSIQPMN